jgi:hypothetical protein
LGEFVLGAAACDGEGMRSEGRGEERELGRENARDFVCVPLLLKLLKAGADVHTQALNPGP